MDEIIANEDAERVSHDPTDGTMWYIPHHGVYHAQKRDKIRVVFDCSARYAGTALNDHLLTGPDLINGLTGVMCRFRKHPIAIMCDIERMFHQFHVKEEDRDYLRFLWWENGNTQQDPVEYRMKVHLFGAASSPGCANYGLKYLAKQHEEELPAASRFIERNFYVDDGVTSVNDATSAINLVREARELCARGSLRLHKFVSNDRTVMDSIPCSERAAGIKDLDLAFAKLPMERALGIQWCVESDNFKFRVTLKDQPLTRRGILSTVASLYDPLGFVAPFVLDGKRILQEMCRRGTSWDDPLPDALRPRWEYWRNDLFQLGELNIPRCYQPPEFGTVTKVELHHFSDASTTGYGQCSYLRLKNDRDMIHCSLAMGKSRVAPTKIMTIPRLELSAAVVSVKISGMLLSELEYEHVEEYFWTDSRVVLGYISNEARRFHTFVANRIQRIHNSTTSQQWKYVPTNDNPADHASRGLTAAELQTSNWFSGPEFLWETEITDEQESPNEIHVGDPEVKNVQVYTTESTEQFCLVKRLSRFSNWSKAVRAIARLQRLARRTKTQNFLTTVEERRKAELFIIKAIQHEVYSDDIAVLSKGSSTIRNNSNLHCLNVFVDDEGVLRVGGRLQESSLPFGVKHPAVLPKDHRVTSLIIGHYHKTIQHQGRAMTINEIRSNGVWIIGCSSAVAAHIHRCVKC